MHLQLFIGFLLALSPISEIRGALFVLVDFYLKHGGNLFLYFTIAWVLNCLVVLLVWLFFDYLHEHFMRMGFYKKRVDRYIESIRKKTDKFERRFEVWGYVLMILFVGVPFTGSGAYTTSFLVWLLDYPRWKSFVAICIGNLIAGFVSLVMAFSIFTGFDFLTGLF